MRLGLILILPLLLASCSDGDPVPPKKFQQLFKNDPVFQALLRDPIARPYLRDPAFWQEFRDPQMRWQLRMTQSEKMYSPPSEKTVDRLERALRQAECVGSLELWDRLYTNGQDTKRGGIDPNKVAFLYREAGVHSFKPHRSIVRPREFYSIDDRPYRLVYGSYDIAADRLTIESCGNNVAG